MAEGAPLLLQCNSCMLGRVASMLLTRDYGIARAHEALLLALTGLITEHHTEQYT